VIASQAQPHCRERTSHFFVPNRLNGYGLNTGNELKHNADGSVNKTL